MNSHWPDIETLRQQLDRGLPGIRVERVAETGSTNSDLLERARASAAGTGNNGADGAVETSTIQVRRSVESTAFGQRDSTPVAVPFAPCLLIAERQTAGRGRRGRTWQSTVGCSLTFSLALPLAGDDWSGLSLAVGVAIAEALEPLAASSILGGPRIALKWPNDLCLRPADASTSSVGRKLGGVLIESLPRGAERVAVIGIGINVLAQPVVDASTGVASWHEIEPAATPALALERIAAPLIAALHLFEREGFAAFHARFAARDALRGHVVRTSASNSAESGEGIADGVSARGSLRLCTSKGVRCVDSGEVSVRAVEAAGGGASVQASPC